MTRRIGLDEEAECSTPTRPEPCYVDRLKTDEKPVLHRYRGFAPVVQLDRTVAS